MLKALIRLLLIALAIYLARSALKRWVDGPDPVPSTEPWPVPARAPQPQMPEPQPAKAPVTVAENPTWVKPGRDGEAPSSHPVKAKLGSRTYREPGSTGYERSKPDRCYPSAEAAEADGFSRARR